MQNSWSKKELGVKAMSSNQNPFRNLTFNEASIGELWNGKRDSLADVSHDPYSIICKSERRAYAQEMRAQRLYESAKQNNRAATTLEQEPPFPCRDETDDKEEHLKRSAIGYAEDVLDMLDSYMMFINHRNKMCNIVLIAKIDLAGRNFSTDFLITDNQLTLTLGALANTSGGQYVFGLSISDEAIDTKREFFNIARQRIEDDLVSRGFFVSDLNENNKDYSTTKQPGSLDFEDAFRLRVSWYSPELDEAVYLVESDVEIEAYLKGIPLEDILRGKTAPRYAQTKLQQKQENWI